MTLHFLQLTFESLNGSKRLDFEVLKKLIIVFLIFGVIYSWIYPIVCNLFLTPQAHLGQLLHKEVVFILRVETYMKIFLLELSTEFC